jgi:hypothetical protein
MRSGGTLLGPAPLSLVWLSSLARLMLMVLHDRGSFTGGAEIGQEDVTRERKHVARPILMRSARRSWMEAVTLRP